MCLILQGENDEIDVVSMDAKSPGAKDLAKTADEDVILEVPESSPTDDKQTAGTNVTIVHEDGEKVSAVDEETEAIQCYCDGQGEGVTLPCEKCKKAFHLGREFDSFPFYFNANWE